MPIYDRDGDWHSDHEAHAFYNLPEFLQEDPMVGALHHLLFDPDITGDMRAAGFNALEDMVRDEYGIEWDDIYDWEDYRAWYDSAA